MKAWQKAQLCAWKFSPDLWQKTYKTRLLFFLWVFINLLPDHEVMYSYIIRWGVLYMSYHLLCTVVIILSMYFQCCANVSCFALTLL